MMARALKREAVDPTFYPVEDDVGESLLHRIMTDLLRAYIAAWLESRGVRALTGASQFFYWRQYAPTESIAPDVYVVEGVAPDTHVDSWKVWERGGKVPSLAIEVVSRDVLKDYTRSPVRCDSLGVKELIIFDPQFEEGRDRCRFQVYRRKGKEFAIVRHTNADRVRSSVLRAWIRVVGEGECMRLRLATGPRGDDLVPTDGELAATAKARADEERARADEEHAKRLALEAEVARLRSKR
jgi:Uma2 family endonuclease